MTHIVTEEKQEWSNGYFKDQFSLCLTKTKSDTNNGVFLSDRKYYKQAIDLMYRIPLTEQYPKSLEEAVPYIIYLSDLPLRVNTELKQYCKLYNKRQVTLLLKDVVMGPFENLDYDHAHSRVMKKLRVVLKP